MKRRAIHVLIPVVAAVTLGGCWFQPGWGPHRSGHNTDEDSLTAEDVASLTEAWSVTIGAGAVRDPVVSPHGVHAVEGRVLATHRLDNGSQRWSVEVLPDLAELPWAVVAPSVRGGEVLVPAYVYRNFAPGSGVHAYSTDTGAGGTWWRPQSSGR